MNDANRFHEDDVMQENKECQKSTNNDNKCSFVNCDNPASICFSCREECVGRFNAWKKKISENTLIKLQCARDAVNSTLSEPCKNCGYKSFRKKYKKIKQNIEICVTCGCERECRDDNKSEVKCKNCGELKEDHFPKYKKRYDEGKKVRFYCTATGIRQFDAQDLKSEGESSQNSSENGKSEPETDPDKMNNEELEKEVDEKMDEMYHRKEGDVY